MRRPAPALLAALVAALAAGCASAPPRDLTLVPPSEHLARQVASLAGKTGARMGIVALHVESGRSLAWNETESFEGASVIKLALLVEALARSREGTLDLQERWRLTPRAVAGGSGDLDEFEGGLLPTNRDLLRLMLALSDNTAANRFIDLFGAEDVNCRMASLGLDGIRLLGRIPDRDPEETEGERWKGLRLGAMTPRDTAELWRRIATESLLDPASSRLARRLLDSPRTSDRVPRLLLDRKGTSWAGKTGTMRGVRADSGVLRTPKGQFVFAMFADRIPEAAGQTVAVNRTMGEIARTIVDTWSRDLPDVPAPVDLPRRPSPGLERVELTPLEANEGAPYMERVCRDEDRLFWRLWKAAGGDLSDACLIPMPNSWWDGESPERVKPVTALVLHHTASDTDESCIAFFQRPDSFVSSHFLVGRDGRLFQFVSLEHRSWHAGESYLHGLSALNKSSIGVEITGDGNRLPFTRGQVETVVRLVGVLTAELRLSAPWIAGHEHIAPGRKVDPGVLFPWNEIVRRGLELAERLAPLVPPRE